MQSVTHRVGVTTKSFSGVACRGVGLLPHPKRLEQDFALLVGKVGETGQNDAGRLDHRLWCSERGGGQDGAVEHPDMGIGVGPTQQHHLGKVQSLGRLAQIVESRADSNPIDDRSRYQGDNLVELLFGFDLDDPDVPIGLEPPRRICVEATQLRFDSRQRLDLIGANYGGNEHEGAILR